MKNPSCEKCGSRRVIVAPIMFGDVPTGILPRKCNSCNHTWTPKAK